MNQMKLKSKCIYTIYPHPGLAHVACMCVTITGVLLREAALAATHDGPLQLCDLRS